MSASLADADDHLPSTQCESVDRLAAWRAVQRHAGKLNMPSATNPFRVCEGYDPADALELSRRIRAVGRMRLQPVATLTRSEDREGAAGVELAASVVPEPFGFERFVEAVRQLGRHRLVLEVSLPPQEWR